MDQKLGRRLRVLRERAGLTATALAGDRLSVATISRIEHGTIDPSLATLRYLAGRLGRSVADLLSDDSAAAEARAALEAIEAWLLLEQPARALQLVAHAERALPAAADVPADAELAPLRSRLAWAAVRANALLDPVAGAPLDAALVAARRANDRWAGARLAVVRSATMDDVDASRLLHGALAGLPPADAAEEEAVVRAQLALLLARCEERGGARETARGLYLRVAAALEERRQPAAAARRLLEAAAPGQSAALLLAAAVAAQRVWLAAMLALARLDLQAGSPAAAARRLRQLPREVPGGAELAAAVAVELRRIAPPTRDRRHGIADDPAWLPLVSALRAGDLEEAEREATLLAAALGADQRERARDVWLRLALAWAEAGNAPRAAQALRAARANEG